MSIPVGGASGAELPGAAWLRAFDSAGRRDLGALMQFKQALVQSLPVAEAFSVYRQAVSLPGAVHLRWQPLAKLHHVVQTRPGAFHEIAPAGVSFVATPPVVVGASNHHPLRGVTRSSYVACLLDVRVRGRSAFIEVDDQAVLDFESQELTRIDDRLDFDPAVFQATKDRVCVIAPGDDADMIEIKEAFSLIGPHSYAFDRWICEYLPKYLAAIMAGALPAVPVLIDAGMPKAHRQALAMMLRGSEIIELPAFQTARVRRLWCAARCAYTPLCASTDDDFAWECVAVPPARFAPIRREMARRADRARSPVTGPERLFLARKPGLHHPLVNAAAIEAVARARGFHVVYPEDLDFAEQVALVGDARFVAGVGPAAMSLPCFAKPGTRLCLLHPADAAGLSVWNGLFDGADIDITALTGTYVSQGPEYPHHSNYRIDEDVFCALLDRWQDDSPPTSADARSGGTPADPDFHEAVADRRHAAPPETRAPMVSIVFVTYKHEKFASAAVRSVLTQTYAPVEIIIVDDASPDATADIIAAELATHPDRSDIRFIRNLENLGAFGSWRKGLSLAKGEFIVMCAGDDVMLPMMVERMVEVWQRKEVSLVTANVLYIDEDTNELNRYYKDLGADYDDTFETLARDGANATCFGAAMGFERKLYEEFGYPPEYLTTEDVMLPFYAYLARGACFIPQPLLKYRVHSHNSSLSLQWERASQVDRLVIEAEIYYVHLAHSLLMATELERVSQKDPVRLGELAGRIKPLLAIQTAEMARKLVEARIALSQLGVTRLIAPNKQNALS